MQNQIHVRVISLQQIVYTQNTSQVILSHWSLNFDLKKKKKKLTKEKKKKTDNTGASETTKIILFP